MSKVIASTILATILTRVGQAPDDLYDVKLSTGDTLTGKLSAATSADTDHIVVTAPEGSPTYVSLTHVVAVAPRKTR